MNAVRERKVIRRLDLILSVTIMGFLYGPVSRGQHSSPALSPCSQRDLALAQAALAALVAATNRPASRILALTLPLLVPRTTPSAVWAGL